MRTELSDSIEIEGNKKNYVCTLFIGFLHGDPVMSAFKKKSKGGTRSLLVTSLFTYEGDIVLRIYRMNGINNDITYDNTNGRHLPHG